MGKNKELSINNPPKPFKESTNVVMPAYYKFTINTELLHSVHLPSFLLERIHLSLPDIEIKITVCS